MPSPGHPTATPTPARAAALPGLVFLGLLAALAVSAVTDQSLALRLALQGALAVVAVLLVARFWRLSSRNWRTVTELRDVQQRTEHFLALPTDMLCVASPEGRFVLVNPVWEQVLGYTADELTARPFLDFVHPDDREATAAEAARIDEGGGSAQFQNRYLAKDGTYRHLLWSSVRAEDGQIYARATDVTARRRRERNAEAQLAVNALVAAGPALDDALPEALRLLGEAMEWEAGIVWLAGEDERLRSASIWTGSEIDPVFVGATESLRLARGESLAGRAWEAERPLWFPDVAQEPSFAASQRAAALSLRSAVCIPLTAGSTTTGVLEFFASRLEPQDDELVGTLQSVGATIGQYIARRRAEEETAAALTELARSNAELEQFAYVASHDLAEPLRMVSSYVQLLERRYAGQLDERADKYIHYAVDGAERMRELIDDLLVYSRVGRVDAEVAPVDLGAVVGEALRRLEAAISEVGAQVTVDEDLPKVFGSDTELVRVVQNLVHNAIKFRGDEPPRVRIGCERAGREWVVSVRDNGIGIEPRYAERIFTVFQRLHTREHYSGTGIGLSIAKKVVERHGGRIWVEAAPGGGSVFRFTLPEAPPDTPVATPEKETVA